MMRRIKMTVDDTQKDDDEPIVRVTLKDRRLFSLRVPMPLGAPTNPVSDEALLAKFKSVSTMSRSTVSPNSSSRSKTWTTPRSSSRFWGTRPSPAVLLTPDCEASRTKNPGFGRDFSHFFPSNRIG